MEMDNDRLSILKSLADNDDNTAAIKELIAYYREIGDNKNAEYYEAKLSKIGKERRADAKKHRSNPKNTRHFLGSKGIQTLAIIAIVLIVLGAISISVSNKGNTSDNADDTLSQEDISADSASDDAEDTEDLSTEEDISADDTETAASEDSEDVSDDTDTSTQDSARSKNTSIYTSDVEIVEDADVIAYKDNIYFTNYAQDAQYFDYEDVWILHSNTVFSEESELVLYADCQFSSFRGSFAYNIENSDSVESITAAIYCDDMLAYSTKITADSEPEDVSFDIDVTSVDYIEVTVNDVEGTNYGSIIFYDAVLCVE